MGYLTYLGAAAGSPNEIDIKVAAQYEAGKLVVAQSGCLACHKIGENGNGGPGPNLTDIGDEAAEGGDPAARSRTRRRRCRRSPGCRRRRRPRWSTSSRSCAASSAHAAMASPEARTGTLEEGQVRAMFDRIARVYDLMNSVMTAGLHHRWRERAADLAARRAGRPRARRRVRAPATSRSSWRAASGRPARWSARTSPRAMLERARDEVRRGRAGSGPTRSTLPYADDELRRRDGRLRRAQLLRPRPRAGRDGARRPAGRPRRRAGDHDAAAAAALDVLLALVRPRRARCSGGSPATRRPTRTCRARSSASRARRRSPARMAAAGLDDVRWILTAGGIIALHSGTVR